tara:strand:+ start:654 stop:818 length:165 start_codon:yes stop_codon:yes gene_type:complete
MELLFFSCVIGFIIMIAYFGITGVNQIIEFKNRQHRLSKSFENNKKQMEFKFDK